MGVVEKGNKIFVPADKLTATEVTVQWQQNFSQRQQQYYSVPFYNKDLGDEQSVLFIQKDYLDSFKNKKTSGDDFTLIVDDSFQYGQNKEKTERWLAYHDKSMNAFQWRFIASMQSKLGGGLADFAGGILKQYIGIDLSILKGLIGDPLRNF
ncbi:hypothetical protein OHC33_006759 [Knufia fluminis]|uniref:Uncharacterized protein n=1 Tax=Knufia fluminis TaxID=191047 RepID=A0AAN8F6J3_9EURO|nr:hypothetical protein OHC33_006759 [Knufia fluminis]